MRVRSNSCTRAYVGNGIGIALIAVLNQVGIVISDEVVVVVWLPTGPTKCIVIGSIKMANAHAVAVIRKTRMSILTLKVAITSISSNLCNHARSRKRVVSAHIVGTIKVLIVVEAVTWTKSSGIGIAAVNIKHIICSNFGSWISCFCLESGCSTANTRDYAIPIVGSRRVVCTHGGEHVVAVLVAGIGVNGVRIKRLTITKRKRCKNGAISLWTHVDGDSCKVVVNVNSGGAICCNRSWITFVTVRFKAENTCIWLNRSSCSHCSNGSGGCSSCDVVVVRRVVWILNKIGVVIRCCCWSPKCLCSNRLLRHGGRQRICNTIVIKVPASKGIASSCWVGDGRNRISWISNYRRQLTAGS